MEKIIIKADKIIGYSLVAIAAICLVAACFKGIYLAFEAGMFYLLAQLVMSNEEEE